MASPGAVIDYLWAENRALREKLGNKRLRFTDDQRRRLAVKGHALGRKALRELALIEPTANAAVAGPIICRERIGGLLRFYRQLAA